MNTTYQLGKELAPLAKSMRERQERIEHEKQDVYGRIGSLIALAQEQGQDCIVAKTKLGKSIKWSDWLNGNVPNLDEHVAAKYERIATERLDTRQCLFAFLPERTDTTEKPTRAKPSFFETVMSHTYKLESLAKENPVATWPEDQREAARIRLRPIVDALWPTLGR